MRLLNLRSVYQRRRIASSCLVHLHPLRLEVPFFCRTATFYRTVLVPGLQTVGMASCSEESGSQRVESEDRLEVSPEEGQGQTTDSVEVCPQPGGGVVQQEGGEEAGQGEQEGAIMDHQQVSHELCQGGEGMLLDSKLDGAHQDDGHQREEGLEMEDQEEMGEPSSRGEGPEGEGEGGAGSMDVQQSGRGEAGAEGLIPHGKFTSEIYKIEVKNLPKVGFGVSS